MAISNFYSDHYEKSTYGGKQYDVYFFDDNILLNDDVDNSISSDEIDYIMSTWYTTTETIDGKIIRKGNENATTETLKLYPYIGVSNQTYSYSQGEFWRYGTEIYKNSNHGGPSYIPDLKTSDHVTTYAINITDVTTGISRALTYDDLLNPSDNYYVSSLNSMTTFLHDYSTNTFKSGIRTIRPASLIKGKTIGGLLGFHELILYNYSVGYDLNTGNEMSEGGAHYVLKDLKSRAKATPLLKDLPITYPDPSYYIGENYILTSTYTSTRQNIAFHVSLKFLVKILQSTGTYVCIGTSFENTRYTDDVLKNAPTCLIGELDNSGRPTYKWLTASDRTTSTSPNLKPEWTAKDQSYTPRSDNTNYFDNIGLNDNYGTSKFVTWYSMTGDQLNGLKDFINDDSRPIGFDPMKNIISVSEYPFNIDTICDTVGTSIIRIGKETYGNFGGDTIANIILTQKRIIDLGEYTFNRTYNNYLDYAPYSDIKVYLPYCNDLITLNPDIVMGETIHCYLIADIITGSCRGVVTCNTCTIGENSGTFGNTVPLSAENVGAYKSAMLNSIGGIASGVLSTAVGGATGNPIALASGTMSVVGSITQLSAVDNTSYVDVKGSSSPCTMYNRSPTPYVIITHTRPKTPDNYAHTIGYPCYKTLTINDLNGYFVCENTDIKINATETEKSMIKNIIESGCYK